MSENIFYPYLDFPKLCVVSCMKVYEQKRSIFRPCNENQLLISFVKPYKAVCSATISRWVRTVMFEAGIDLSKFGTHSSRGAMASKVFWGGGSLSDILKAADWSNASTFVKFYLKPIEHVSNVALRSFELA